MAPTKRSLVPSGAKPGPDLCVSACDPRHNFFRFCPPLCVPLCPAFCQPFHDFLHSPQPPPPPPSSVGLNYHHHHHDILSPMFITMIVLLASSFVLAISYLIYLAFFSYPWSPASRHQRRSGRAMEFDQSMDVLDFHPVWYIATVGLQRSTIDSIAVCNFKKGDGLVQATSCAVCLAEFLDGDTLRLLPKCCHAFHVPCIDIWLASHTTCPVCRALVLQDNDNPQPDARVVEIAHDPSPSGGVSAADLEGVERRPMRRTASMDSLCVEVGEKANNTLGERSLSCTGKLFSSSRNGFQ